jgi:hypothetical protein
MTICALLTAAALAAAAGDAGLILHDLPPPDGWTASGEVAVYAPEKLWDYIDGGAQAYVEYGVVETATASFQPPGARLPRITVDLHRMREPKGAFGIYASERSGKGAELGIGRGSSMEKGMLLFWSGDSYVRIVSDASSDTTIALARALAGILPARDDSLPMLAHFPAEGRIPGGEGYTAVSFQGIKRLDDVWSASYADSAGSYVLFLRRNRPPIRAAELPPKAKILAAPKTESPIEMIDMGVKDQVLLAFYVQNCWYMAGYIGARPNDDLTKGISAWVESLPKAR